MSHVNVWALDWTNCGFRYVVRVEHTHDSCPLRDEHDNGSEIVTEVVIYHLKKHLLVKEA